MDVRKGMVSYRIGFSECELGRASDGQHARSALFNDSCRRCQEQNSDQFGPRLGAQGARAPTVGRWNPGARIAAIYIVVQSGQVAPRS